MKSHQRNLFLAGFSRLKPQCGGACRVMSIRVRCLNGMVQMATGYFIIFSASLCFFFYPNFSKAQHENIVKIVACSRYKEQLLQRALKILSQSYTRSSRAGTGSQMCGNLEAVEMLSGEKMPHTPIFQAFILCTYVKA